VSGISIRELDKAKRDNKVAITDIEVVGAANIHRAKADTHCVFIVPPNFPVWIERLHHRGELPEDEIRRRLESALEEFEAALREPYYNFVFNDRLEDAVSAVNAIAEGGEPDTTEQAEGRKIISELITDTKQYLEA
jgi:guanylate kinase